MGYRTIYDNVAAYITSAAQPLVTNNTISGFYIDNNGLTEQTPISHSPWVFFGIEFDSADPVSFESSQRNFVGKININISVLRGHTKSNLYAACDEVSRRFINIQQSRISYSQVSPVREYEHDSYITFMLESTFESVSTF